MIVAKENDWVLLNKKGKRIEQHLFNNSGIFLIFGRKENEVKDDIKNCEKLKFRIKVILIE